VDSARAMPLADRSSTPSTSSCHTVCTIAIRGLLYLA
jgi:hypothetical protein